MKNAKHGVCSKCGSATGVIEIKTAEMFKPIRTEHRCNHCNPELFYSNKAA